MAATGSITGSTILNTGISYVGKIPYQLGASIKQTAAGVVADCSSFVQYIFSQNGIDLPRNAGEQYQATKTGGGMTSPLGGAYSTGKTIALSNIQPGDLLFFGGYTSKDNPPGIAGIQHVAIYAGNGNVLQEGGSISNVNTASLSDPALTGHLLYATRPTALSDTASQGPATQISGSDSSTGQTPGLNLNPADAAANAVKTVLGPVGDAITAIGGTFSDIAVFFGIVLLALVLIIGGVVLLRPQSA